MKKYHYSQGENSYGPFTLEELRSKTLYPDTLIWTEELVTWKKAEDVAELQDLFRPGSSNQPPPVFGTNPEVKSSQETQAQFQRPPKTYLIESILTTIFCCWPVGIPAIVYAARVEKKFYTGNIIGAEEDSAKAKKWIIINLIACVIGWILYLAIFGLAFFGSI